jgi:membrane protein required for colicin V production
MIWVDYFIVGTIVVSALVSLFRGFVREALSLAIWILAFWVAWTFFRDLAPAFGHWVGTPSVQFGIAFGLLLIATLLVGGILNYLIGRLIDETGLSGTDRMLGMVFGLARGVLVVAILVLLARATPLPQDPWWKESALLGQFDRMADWLVDFLPAEQASWFRQH